MLQAGLMKVPLPKLPQNRCRTHYLTTIRTQNDYENAPENQPLKEAAPEHTNREQQFQELQD